MAGGLELYYLSDPFQSKTFYDSVTSGSRSDLRSGECPSHI